jgi:hypothetical protein
MTDDQPRSDNVRIPLTAEERARNRRVINRLHGVTEVIEPILKRHNVTDEQLAELLSRPFRKKFRQFRKKMAVNRELYLAHGGAHAARKMAEAVNDLMQGFNDLQRKVCVDMIRLSRWRAPARKEKEQLHRDLSEYDESNHPLMSREEVERFFNR